MMNKILSEKLKKLPSSPGVYFHRDEKGEIIYVGKAAVLKNRVRQYFQKSKDFDAKTRALVAEIHDTDWVETESEIDALFLEAEMVKRYMPRFNILLRDDKSLTYIRIDMKSKWPYVSFTRNPMDDSAEYFGPYYNSFVIKKALRLLRRVFPYYVKPIKGEEARDLDSHLGLSPVGLSSEEYKANLRGLISYIKGNRVAITNELEKEMKTASSNHDFEKAAILRNRIYSLKELKRRIVFGDKEFLDISKDEALNDLAALLKLKGVPVRIEAYDISHMSGTNVVASMVVFKNGVSNRAEYRKFKTKIERNDDFQNMQEILTRRLHDKNLRAWGKPDLVLIDGGKGQLESALKARDEMGQSNIPFVGLAKKEEQIVIKKDFELDDSVIDRLKGFLEISENFVLINLPNNSSIIKLFQRIRDESHRFAVSYHTSLKRSKQTASLIDEIPGIGSKTRSKLIKKFGSLRNISTKTEGEIADAIGPSKAKLVYKFLQDK